MKSPLSGKTSQECKRQADEIHALISDMATPETLEDVVSVIVAASRLVETAGYGAATNVGATTVTEVFLLAAQLDTLAERLRLRV